MNDWDYDLLTCGLFFNDLNFTGLPDRGPTLGQECRVGPCEQIPGGIANSAIAAIRLGVSVCMLADAGDDLMTLGALSSLGKEGIDTSHCAMHPGWQTPMTVILNYHGDRAMVTSESAHPGPCVMRARHAPSARVVVTHLQPFPMPWLAQAAGCGSQIIGDVGFDESGRWDLEDLPDLGLCRVFTPNLLEATSYTRTDSVDAALDAFAERVPLPVVTLGPDGCAAVDAATGERVRVAAVHVEVVDTCGAGDVFGAALGTALLAPDLTLTQRLRFATLAASLTIARPGGATSAPSLRQMQSWARHAEGVLARDFGFIADLSPAAWHRPAPPGPAATTLAPTGGVN
jgi:sugar/nucleoside kinase (ribokinase family)